MLHFVYPGLGLFKQSWEIKYISRNTEQLSTCFLWNLMHCILLEQKNLTKFHNWLRFVLIQKRMISIYLCMESWGMPQSTVRMPTPEARIGPIVDPHPISFLTTNSYTKVNNSKKLIPIVIWLTLNKNQNQWRYCTALHTHTHTKR